MRIPILLILFVLVSISCKDPKRTSSSEAGAVHTKELKHAKGFRIAYMDGYKTITITNPWPGAKEEFTYLLIEKGTNAPTSKQYDAVIEVPVRSVVVTSTTHIPSLEMLDVSSALVGFPNLDYISSQTTRNRIDAGAIKELGKNEAINTEVLIDLNPDAVVTFAVEGGNKTVDAIKKTGIPVLYNADWTETTPLGKAEWIKFFGLLFGKEKKADSIFKEIEFNYQTAKELAASAGRKPTVLSGAMYQDVWYLPQGDSWAAQLIEDAHGEYLWHATEGTGSISLNLEAVLEKGQHADFWIGPGQFTGLQQMQESHPVYAEFEAFQQKNVFSFTTNKGVTGGVLYYELAPNRPDLVLQDMIKILHPHLLPEYEFFFFSKLE
ncbi:ABC transporter substrate-binding protein [Altibacter sp.]|uniref:ABC transporter substrate-binding protein n=1 Tax=Altibacter sp. TaxID=2024823 RepID=UPI0025826883|nr:ABC transporter substrate-binding protein [Altibacter sp.]MCW9036329.1 ABC transporter substrate-binding protein [Altibacter sp.]